MKQKIYTIRDAKAEAYLKPFFERNNGTAVRAIEAAIQQDKNFNAYAEDYSLYLIGEYDDTTGRIDSHIPLHVEALIDIRDRLQRHAEAEYQKQHTLETSEASRIREEGPSRTELMMGKDFPRTPQGGE